LRTSAHEMEGKLTIGDEIRRRREEQGLTGFELALKAGMAPSAISLIENGKRTPSSTSVLKLAGALGVEVGELYPKAQIPLPLEDERLMDRPEVQEWLREQGHMEGEEFLEWARSLGADTDDEEDVLQAIEQGIRVLRSRRNEVLDAIRTTEARKALFPTPSGLSKEQIKHWLLKPPGRWQLVNEIRREYVRRELALTNYSIHLFAEGKASGYLSQRHDPGRHNQLLEHRHKVLEKRRRILEESYAKAVA
jgi:transcriptional regulator with XRE-family HTH domain